MNEQQSIIGKGTSYFKDSLQELKKVSTPTRQETIQATIVTVIIVVFVAVVVSLLDLVFGQLMQAVL